MSGSNQFKYQRCFIKLMFGILSSVKVDNCYDNEQKSEKSATQHELERKKNYQGSLQNGQITQFYFKKLNELEISLSLIVIINLFLIIIATNQSFPAITPGTAKTLNICLYFSMLCVGVVILLLTMRALTVLQLEKEQKKIYKKENIFSSNKILYLFMEWAILLLQPYPFLQNITFSTNNAYQNYVISYPLNDLLAILSFGRVYILLRTFLILTPYMNNRSNRLCKMYGCHADFSYSLKCMFKEHPLKLICIFYSLTAFMFAYLVYLAERQLSIQSSSFQQNAATSFQNALWLILITTTTVGYGDYFPETPLGRIIILFVAIWGTLIVSIMVVVVSSTLNMQKTEIRTSKILNKLELREELEQKAGMVIGYFLLRNLTTKTSKSVKKEYSRKMVKALGQFKEKKKEIKQIVEFSDLQDEIATHFLKLNSDIEILNSNQDLIIQYIHNNFNAVPENKNQPLQQSDHLIKTERQISEQEQKEDEQFMELFRKNIKVKVL